jgi:hypothetical protein
VRGVRCAECVAQSALCSVKILSICAERVVRRWLCARASDVCVVQCVI